MVGIILTTFNQWDKTRQCLNSLGQATPERHKLVVVDNHSHDGTPDHLRRLGVAVITNAADTGLARALNQGIDRFMDDGEVTHLAWIHNDMLFFRGWLPGLVLVANRPGIGKLAPWNVSGDPSQYDDAWAARFMAGHRDILEPGNNCPWLMRKEVIRQVGRFDEQFIRCGGLEDWDYNNRVNDCGYFVGTTGASVVWHEGMGTRRHIQQQEACQHNAGVYARKWGNRQWV